MNGENVVKTLFTCSCFFLIFFTFLTESNAQEPNWPQFHGPNRDNISKETGLLKKWPKNGPELIWTLKGLGHGYSTVSIANGMIYTAGNIEGHTVITAISMKGKILWRKNNGKAWKNPYPGTRGTPTIDNNRLYYENPFGNVICLNAKTGEKVWKVNILEQFKSENIRWGLSESILIDGDHVICCPGGPETCMVALNKLTGKSVWKAPSTGDLAGYTSPILVRINDLRIIISLTSKAIIGVNADTGELLWRVKHESHADENVQVPLYHDGEIFISSVAAGSVKWKIEVKGKKAALKEIWRSKEMDNHHGGVVLVNGYLYGSSCAFNKGKWICLNWETGEKKYAVKGIGKGSLMYADEMLYALSRNGIVGIVRPNPKKYGLVNSFKIPKGGKGMSWAHPVVCNGRLYIRHSDFLYVYDIKENVHE